MRESIMTARPWSSQAQAETKGENYHSVEFSPSGLADHYLFKIWCMGPSPLCFLVKENSDILNGLQVGDTLNMKYYPNDPGYSPAYLPTQIRDITRKHEGRFKGHCLVGLQILENQE
jgi:hypothetical protein